MGMLTTTLSMDSVTQSERARAADLRRRGIREGSAQGAPGYSGGSGATVPALTTAQVTYRPDAAVERNDTARFVAALMKSEPNLGTQVGQLYQQHPASSIARTYAAKYGLSVTNIVDLSAMYLGSAWFISRGSTGDPTPAQMHGLRSQLAGAFARTPSFSQLNNSDKQHLADSMLLEAITYAAMLEGAHGNQANIRTVAASAADGARNRIHFDVTRYNLTNLGFVPKS